MAILVIMFLAFYGLIAFKDGVHIDVAQKMGLLKSKPILFPKKAKPQQEHQNQGRDNRDNRGNCQPNLFRKDR